MDVRTLTGDTLAEASGRSHRVDAVLPGTGGPAGNARLTAWTGLILLVLFLAELVTLLDVRGLISWHVAIGVVLIPPALLKTASTGWRIVRYYTGNRPYREAGPPPLLLRVLGPLVVFFTVAVLASGVALILAGARSSVAGVDLTLLHKATFVLWGIVTGLHVLGRLIPAARLAVTARTRVPGRFPRGGLVALALALAVAGAVGTLAVVDLSAFHTRPHRPGISRAP